jgi:hypothetical protein
MLVIKARPPELRHPGRPGVLTDTPDQQPTPLVDPAETRLDKYVVSAKTPISEGGRTSALAIRSLVATHSQSGRVKKEQLARSAKAALVEN